MAHRIGVVEKSVQAACVLLRADAGEQMSYLRLLKLLYIAERENLRATGSPIIGGRVLAIENGPVHGEVYDLLKGEHAHEELWSRFIRKRGYVLQLVSDPGVLALSKQEIRTLNETAQKHTHLTEWEIVELSQTFAEWEKNHRPGVPKQIPLGDMLAALGFSQADIQGILEDQQECRRMDSLAINSLPAAVP